MSSGEFPHFRGEFSGQHLWIFEHFVVTSGAMTEALTNKYVAAQEGERSAAIVNPESTSVRSYNQAPVVRSLREV